MKIYVVSYLNFISENEIENVVVYDQSGVLSDLEILNEGMRKLNKIYEGATGFEDCQDLEEAKGLAFDSDQAVNVILVDTPEV